MGMTEHTVPTTVDAFAELCSGEKTFEIRRDAGYAVGDILCFQEYEPIVETHPAIDMKYDTTRDTGRRARRRVSHLLKGQKWLPSGFVVMALIDVYSDYDREWRRLHKAAAPHKKMHPSLNRDDF